MVNLDIDMELLAKYAYLIGGQQGVSGAKGTENAKEDDGVAAGKGTKFYKQKGYGAKNLVEDLDLRDPKIRYAIIKMMKESEVMKLLPLLSKKAMLQGMKFFTVEKLSTILSYLPEEMLAKMCQQMFSPKQMMELMPLKNVRKFLTNEKIDKKSIFKYMEEQMKPTEIAAMYHQATGQSIGTNNKEEMLVKMAHLDKKSFNKALQCMNPKDTKNMAAFVLKEQPDLTKEFSSLEMSMCFDKCAKNEIIKGMEVLEPEALQKVLEYLPPQLLEQVVTQIDPEVFADQLLNNLSQVLDRMQL